MYTITWCIKPYLQDNVLQALFEKPGLFSYTIFARRVHVFTNPSQNGKSSLLSRALYLGTEASSFDGTLTYLISVIDKI